MRFFDIVKNKVIIVDDKGDLLKQDLIKHKLSYLKSGTQLAV